MPSKPQVLWIGAGEPFASLRQAAARRWTVQTATADDDLPPRLAGGALAVVHANGLASDPRRLTDLLAQLAQAGSVAVVLLPPGRAGAGAQRVLAQQNGPFLCASQDAPSDELRAMLAAAEQLQPALQALRAELARCRCPEHSLRQAKAITEEMQIAARLQRDFLPRRLPEVGDARFVAMYRPVSWVSGDIYDIARLDETKVGFYVADAVGHGLPAALLTMFIKRALQTKRIVGNQYQIIPPEETLGDLNRDICHQGLSSCQFCTAFYGVLDTADLTLTYARAGHPEPVLLRADGTVLRLKAPGALLGIVPEEQYLPQTVQLIRGDRLVLFTDGAERVLGLSAPDRHDPDLRRWAGISREHLILKLTAGIDALPPGPEDDDVTVVVLDVE